LDERKQAKLSSLCPRALGAAGSQIVKAGQFVKDSRGKARQIVGIKIPEGAQASVAVSDLDRHN
jgi:hypothetical protein